MSAKRLLLVATVTALLLPSWVASAEGAAPKPPPKRTPPKPQPQHHHTHHPNYNPNLWWTSPFMYVRPPIRPAYPYPWWSYPVAGVNPGYTPPGTTPTESMSGNQAELVLDVAKIATIHAPKPGGGYQPTKFDALKADQTVTVLVKSADKPASWTMVGKVISFEAGDPSKLTLLAQLNPAQGEFDPKGKFVTAVTIRPTAAVAQK
jgi:hypothetical protein